jgi:formylglycine-generating enzyme required for sulfatase activity
MRGLLNTIVVVLATPCIGVILACRATGPADRERPSPVAEGNSGAASARVEAGPSTPHSIPSASTPIPSALASSAPGAEPATAPVDDMVHILAVSFWMGCAKTDTMCAEDEKPRHRVSLDAYYLDRNEVTVRDFRLFCGERCRAETSSEPIDKDRRLTCNWGAGRELHPVTCVDPYSAKAYCKRLGKRLPTEAEWEYAARGKDERLTPWGVTNPGEVRCRELHSTCPVGSFPDGASPFGVLDMAGNAAELVSDTYHKGFYSISPLKNPIGPTTPIPFGYKACGDADCFAVRGGSFRSSEAEIRTTARAYSESGGVDIGFRCARSSEPAKAAPAPKP